MQKLLFLSNITILFLSTISPILINDSPSCGTYLTIIFVLAASLPVPIIGKVVEPSDRVTTPKELGIGGIYNVLGMI
jgi:magnesium-transporting ATPase (P-type)